MNPIKSFKNRLFIILLFSHKPSPAYPDMKVGYYNSQVEEKETATVPSVCVAPYMVVGVFTVRKNNFSNETPPRLKANTDVSAQLVGA